MDMDPQQHSHQDQRFDALYQEHLNNFFLYKKKQDKRSSTIDAMNRGVRRIAQYFDYPTNNLLGQQLKTYFVNLITSHSWSAVKLELSLHEKRSL